MSRKRQRRRASEIAAIQPKTGLTTLLMIAVGLAVIIIFKVVMSDETAEVFQTVVGDPALELPASASEKSTAGDTPPVKQADAGARP